MTVSTKLPAVLSAISMLALTGCGTVASNSDVGPVHVAGQPVIADTPNVQIVEGSPPTGVATAEVSGYSCKNKMWDKDPSRDNAIALMKRQATEKGFDAVASVQVKEDQSAIVKNCWSGLIATGTAFKRP